MKSRISSLILCIAVVVPLSRVFAQEEDPPLPEIFSEFQTEMFLQEDDTLASVPYSPQRTSSLTWYSMFTNIPGDWLRAGESVVRTENLPVLGGIALATGALLLVDHSTYMFSHGLYVRSPDVRFASNQLLRAGDGKTTIGIAAAFALYGFIGGDSRALRTASGTVEALLASGLAVQVLKRITGRESPQVMTRWRGAWRPFPNLGAYSRNQPRYYAFPSGHITTAMATLTVIAENYPEAGWIRPVGYGIVGLAGVSLVGKGWHWYSDFPLAVAIGFTFGRLASHHDDEGTARDEGSPKGTASLQVLPRVSPAGAGVSLAFNF